MGFADAYLLKAGLREALIEPEPHPGLNIIVTLPVYNESRLERCLDSLFQCVCGGGADTSTGSKAGASEFGAGLGSSDGADTESGPVIRAEVLILINAPSDAPAAVLEQNQTTLERTRLWIEAHKHPCIDFHVWLDHSFGKKEAGVGTARKILMDEAVRRFSSLDRPEGIITGLDADALVQPNYLEALVEHFRSGSSAPGPDGCSIRFEHPLSGTAYEAEVYEAITLYELHLRYYLQAQRSTSYPGAYHTVGSSMAVRADIYCLEGGMNRRKAGEDFYFIQKLAQRGNFSQCNSTCVRPSPRPSDRVPFGTGRAVSLFLKGEDRLLTYHPEPFRMLGGLFSGVNALYSGPTAASVLNQLPGVLQEFLQTQGFEAALMEIRNNSSSPSAFRKRFWRWFNMFRIMKFLHFARERGFPDIPVGEAASELLRILDPEHTGIPSVGTDPKKLLLIYRMLDLR